MAKFFVPKENITETCIFIRGDDVNHISNVLRTQCGDTLDLCDGRGYDYVCRVSDINKDKITCDIVSRKKSDTESNLEVTLIQGIPKNDKMEFIIQKTTELGITRIIPCSLARCVSKPDKNADKKIVRWQKIAESAAKQSGRGIIPEISAIMSLNDALNSVSGCDLVFAPYECEEHVTLKEIFKSVTDPHSVAFIIGPEGGFDIEEINKIKTAGVPTVTLGKRIMRCETAPVAALAMLEYELGDVNK